MCRPFTHIPPIWCKMQHYEYVVEDHDGLAISVFDSRAEVVEFLRAASVSFTDTWHVKDLWDRPVVSGTFEVIELWAELVTVE